MTAARFARYHRHGHTLTIRASTPQVRDLLLGDRWSFLVGWRIGEAATSW